MVSSSHAGPAGSPPRSVRYELLTLGDELLLGLTANGHLSFVGSQLGRRGVLLQRNATVTDEADVIEREVRRSLAESDVVIVTGGLGPTVDDRTREAVAAVLGQPLVFDESIKAAIVARFAQIGRRVSENNLRQAYRFADGEVLPNANGTAPGLWYQCDGKVICLLPGPPNELQPMFLEQVVPRLERLGLLREREAYVQIRTAGIGESALEVKLQPLFAPHGGALSIAFCAHQGQVDCRLSSPGGEFDLAKLDEIAAACARLLGEDFVCFGHDTLGRVCADLLRANEKTLAVAEAATGGLLAQAFSDLCGACKFFAGGVVCCSQDSKMILLGVPECLMQQHGVASPECSVAMATGVAEALQADYGLAVTGFASATGGTGGNPVGAITLALHTPQGTWSRQLNYPGPRATVKQRAVNAALDWLRRELIRSGRSQGATIARPGIPG
jgi:nicotinamide-nucleotide amidase